MMLGFVGEAIALRIFGEMAANPFMLAHIPLTSVGCWVADHSKRSSSEAGGGAGGVAVGSAWSELLCCPGEGGGDLAWVVVWGRVEGLQMP